MAQQPDMFPISDAEVQRLAFELASLLELEGQAVEAFKAAREDHKDIVRTLHKQQQVCRLRLHEAEQQRTAPTSLLTTVEEPAYGRHA
jgi:hypothetical protein